MNADANTQLADPWAALAEHARALVELADQSAAKAASAAAELEPSNLGDPLAELDRLALTIRGTVAACRRATWQALRDEGHTYEAIGERWGVTKQAVRQALVAPKRPR